MVAALVLACDPSGQAGPVATTSPSAAPAVPVASTQPAAPAVDAPPDPPPSPDDADGRTRAVVYLVSLGPFDAGLQDAIAEALAAELQVEVKRLGTRPLPDAAWYAPRKRYRADVILDYLPTLIPDEPESTRILALTQKDISTTKGEFADWGVFGLGNMPGQAAVVSSFRLRRKAKGPAHVQKRVVNTSIHEVGHMLGLDHCTEHAELCPMQDAEGSIVNTDTSTGRLGPQCRAELDRELPLRG